MLNDQFHYSNPMKPKYGELPFFGHPGHLAHWNQIKHKKCFRDASSDIRYTRIKYQTKAEDNTTEPKTASKLILFIKKRLFYQFKNV